MGEGEDGLVENHMTGDEDTTSLEIDAAVAFVVCWVAEKDTRDRARGKFVLRGGGLVRIAKASKDAQGGVVGGGIVEAYVGDCEVYGLRGA